VTEAVSGDAGLRVAKECMPQVILLDLVMPGMSGGDVLTALKEDPATQAIPVIIVTSQMVGEETLATLLNQAAALLFKHSLTRDTLLVAVRQAIDRVGVTTGPQGR